MRRHLNTQGSYHVLCARLVCKPFSLVEVLSQTRYVDFPNLSYTSTNAIPTLSYIWIPREKGTPFLVLATIESSPPLLPPPPGIGWTERRRGRGRGRGISRLSPFLHSISHPLPPPPAGACSYATMTQDRNPDNIGGRRELLPLPQARFERGEFATLHSHFFLPEITWIFKDRL